MCAFSVCDEPPSCTLPPEMQALQMFFCPAHAEKLARTISERNYADFIGWLKDHGIRGEPVLEPFLQVEDRRCGIPSCGKDGNRGVICSGPRMAQNIQSGWDWQKYVWLCEEHAPAGQFVIDRCNALRVIRELQSLTLGEESRSPKREVDSSAVRAEAVQCVLKELAEIRPTMTATADFDSIRKRFPNSIAFKVCETNPDLRLKLESIAGHQQFTRFAIEIVAANYGRKYTTVEKDWKTHKPRKPKLRNKPPRRTSKAR